MNLDPDDLEDDAEDEPLVTPGFTSTALLSISSSSPEDEDDAGPLVPLTPEEEEAQRREQVATTTMLREFQRGAPIEEDLVSDFSSALDEKLEESDVCPKCGGSLEAEQDPDSLLSFPMIFLWTCASCGHNERREDTA